MAAGDTVTTIHQLPSELLCEIASHASQEDLKALRLADRRIGACACQFLFQSIDATSSLKAERSAQQDQQQTTPRTPEEARNGYSFQQRPALRGLIPELERLQEVASRDHLAKHVRTLTIGTGTVYSFSHEYHWCYGMGFDPVPMSVRYLDTAARMMPLALPKLLRLCDLHVHCHCKDHWRRCNRGCTEQLSGPLDRLLRTILAILSTGTLLSLRTWEQSMPVLNSLSVYGSSTQVDGIFNNLISLTLRIDKPYDANPYQTSPMSWTAPGSTMRPEARSPDKNTVNLILKSIFSAANKLRHLHLSAGEPYDDDRPEAHFHVDLNSIVCLPLTELKLTGIYPSIKAISSPQTTCEINWAVERLTLRHATMPLASLLWIMGCNQHTIRQIRYYCLSLASGCWAEVFAYMRQNLQNLEHASLDSVVYSRSGTSSHLIPGVDHKSISSRSDLSSTEPAEYEELDMLYAVVNSRRRFGGAALVRTQRAMGVADINRVYGPEKRQFTLLDKWLGLEPM